MMTKETMQVKGMSCDHCIRSIEGSVGKLNGVSRVAVHLDTGTVDVEYDPDRVSRRDIEKTIGDQGYEVA
jgi:copper chaperone